MKRAFLVLGPESSGNKLLTELLVKAGCQGDFGHEQKFDAEPGSGTDIFATAADQIVWRRSLPHGDEHSKTAPRGWPDLDGMLARLRRNGYHDVRVVAVVRTLFCAARSQIDNDHLKGTPADKRLAKAEENIAAAMLRIASFAQGNQLPIRYLTYESIIYDYELVRRAFHEWNLELPATFKLRRENDKYLNWRPR